MPYDLAEFEAHLPTLHQCVTVDAETDEALHAARWSVATFESFAEFVRFTFRYSCVIQPFVYDPQRDDLDEWFHADPDADQRAEDFVTQNKAIAEDSRGWMSLNYPSVSIEWLTSGTQGRLITLEDGDWPAMVGQDSEGYFSVFVADAT